MHRSKQELLLSSGFQSGPSSWCLRSLCLTVHHCGVPFLAAVGQALEMEH